MEIKLSYPSNVPELTRKKTVQYYFRKPQTHNKKRREFARTGFEVILSVEITANVSNLSENARFINFAIFSYLSVSVRVSEARTRTGP